MIRAFPLLLLSLPALAEPGAGANPPSLTSWLLSSLMVIGLILVLGFLLKKSKIATAMGGGQMRVIASLPVGYKEKLLVVKVGEQQLLLGVTPQQVNFLYRLEEPLDESQPQAFSQQLGKLMGKHEKANGSRPHGGLLVGLLSLLILCSPLALAQDGMSAVTIKTMADGSQEYSLTLQVLALMTALSFLPAMVIMMTSFTRIIIVLGILRQAIGLQQSPSNQVLIGIALFMSFFIMSPVLDRINNEALQPYLAETIQAKEALEKAELPIHQFMLAQTRIKDLNTFMEIANVQVDKPADVPLRVLIPAFVTSELKTAFQIGFMLFLPFLVIDLVVASILMAMGMMMLSPMLVSLPFKLMLFVMVDGWNLILGSLANSFGLGAGG